MGRSALFGRDRARDGNHHAVRLQGTQRTPGGLLVDGIQGHVSIVDTVFETHCVVVNGLPGADGAQECMIPL